MYYAAIRAFDFPTMFLNLAKTAKLLSGGNLFTRRRQRWANGERTHFHADSKLPPSDGTKDWFYGLGLWCENPIERRCMLVNARGHLAHFHGLIGHPERMEY
jgi:hypothetical protein